VVGVLKLKPVGLTGVSAAGAPKENPDFTGAGGSWAA
jgi:hypothetical protein